MKDNNHKKFFSLLSDTTFKYLFKKEENKPFFRKTISSTVDLSFPMLAA
mgnify:CR=1 FL=1